MSLTIGTGALWPCTPPLWSSASTSEVCNARWRRAPGASTSVTNGPPGARSRGCSTFMPPPMAPPGQRLQQAPSSPRPSTVRSWPTSAAPRADTPPHREGRPYRDVEGLRRKSAPLRAGVGGPVAPRDRRLHGGLGGEHHLFDHWSDQQRGLAGVPPLRGGGGRLVLVDQFSSWLAPALPIGRGGKARTPRQASRLLDAADFPSLTWHRLYAPSSTARPRRDGLRLGQAWTIFDSHATQWCEHRSIFAVRPGRGPSGPAGRGGTGRGRLDAVPIPHPDVPG